MAKKKIRKQVCFEIKNRLSFVRTIEVEEGYDENDLEEALEHYHKLQNWGDLDDMFNLEGEPEIEVEDVYDVKPKHYAQNEVTHKLVKNRLVYKED